MLDPAPFIETLAASLRRLLAALGDTAQPADVDLAALAGRYQDAKTKRSRRGVERALALNQAELRQLEKTLDAAVARARELAAADAPSETAARNVAIAALRCLGWLETVERRVEGLELLTPLNQAITEDRGRKQVHALELIIRSLIGESHGSQEELAAHLDRLFGSELLVRWRRLADPDDLLSGTTFSELAGLFVAEEEFPRYEPIYEGKPFLTYLRDRRRTIQTFLEDVRRIRNVLAHSRKVTDVQLTLLDLYYDELVAPVRLAHDEGRTEVDPRAYLTVSAETLAAYYKDLDEDLQTIQDDVAGLRAALEDRVAKEQTLLGVSERVSRRIGLVGAAVVLVAIGVGVLVWMQGRTQERVDDVAATSRESTAAVRDATGVLRDTASELREAAATLEARTRDDGTIVDPRTPQEHYQNARVFDGRGDYGKARAAYLAVIRDDPPFVDPHLRLQALVRAQEGRAAAAELYGSLEGRGETPVLAFAKALTLPDGARRDRLIAFCDEHPDFTPARWALSREVTEARVGPQTYGERQLEASCYEALLAASEDGRALAWYLDAELASGMLREARERLVSLRALDPGELVRITILKLGKVTSASVTVMDNTAEIFVRAPGDAEHRSTGFLGFRNPATGQPQPNSLFEMGPASSTVTISVRYRDVRGLEQGPFEMTIDPRAAVRAQAKRLLVLSQRSWCSFREFRGRLLFYFSHLVSNATALRSIRYGVDVQAPDTDFPVREVDWTDPNNMRDAEILVALPLDAKFVTVQVEWYDGERSDVVRFDP